jgi:c-di-GMP-binding flagellar brake protein YcgR
MIRPHSMTGRHRDDVLAQAAQQSAQLVLTCRIQGRWQAYKSCLLSVDPIKGRMVISAPTDAEAEPLEFVRGEQIGVTFRHRNTKCLFATVVLGTSLPGAGRRGTSAGSVVVLACPDQLEQLQRRAYHRVEIPAESRITVRFWRGGVAPDGRHRIAAAPEFVGRLLDLSVGGIRVGLSAQADPQLQPDEMVGLEFSPEPYRPSIVLEACFRHLQPVRSDKVSLGFQFIGLELHPNGHETLARLARTVRRLQRNQAPKAHLTT